VTQHIFLEFEPLVAASTSWKRFPVTSYSPDFLHTSPRFDTPRFVTRLRYAFVSVNPIDILPVPNVQEAHLSPLPQDTGAGDIFLSYLLLPCPNLRIHICTSANLRGRILSGDSGDIICMIFRPATAILPGALGDLKPTSCYVRPSHPAGSQNHTPNLPAQMSVFRL
jgi:hypothetical protein